MKYENKLHEFLHFEYDGKFWKINSTWTNRIEPKSFCFSLTERQRSVRLHTRGNYLGYEPYPLWMIPHSVAVIIPRKIFKNPTSNLKFRSASGIINGESFLWKIWRYVIEFKYLLGIGRTQWMKEFVGLTQRQAI